MLAQYLDISFRYVKNTTNNTFMWKNYNGNLRIFTLNYAKTYALCSRNQANPLPPNYMIIHCLNPIQTMLIYRKPLYTVLTLNRTSACINEYVTLAISWRTYKWSFVICISWEYYVFMYTLQIMYVDYIGRILYLLSTNQNKMLKHETTQKQGSLHIYKTRNKWSHERKIYKKKWCSLISAMKHVIEHNT